MVKINFKEFSKYAGIKREKKEVCDVREDFADLIYRFVGGIKAHALAFKIYGSTGEEEYSDEELEIIKRILEQFGLPGFIDSFNEQINNK